MKDSISLVKVVSVVAMASVSLISALGMVGLVIVQFAYSEKNLYLDTQVVPKSIGIELTVDSVQKDSEESGPVSETEHKP